MRPVEHLHASPQAVAAHVAGALRRAITERAQASLAVSGGRSPVPMFEALREQALDWPRVSVVLVDERVVPRDHADSNTALVRRHLLQGAAAQARFTPFFDEVPPGPDALVLDALVREADGRLAPLPWPLDVAVLGMGEDAHTASLFPDGAGYAHAIETGDRLAWVVPAAAPHARITLTLSALLAARELVLPIAGEAKRAVYRHARDQADTRLPISLVLNQDRTPVSVWLG